MEESLFRRRSKAIPPTSTMGHCYRLHQGRPENTGLQNLPTIIGRTGKTGQLHQGELGEGIHSTLQISVLVTILLRGQEKRQTPTSGGLQKAQFVHYS